MASGTSVSNNAYGIINDAMVDAGLLQEGQLANSEQLAKFMRRLNDIINLWQTQGLKLFLQQEVFLTMVADEERYLFGSVIGGPGVVMLKPTRVLQAYVLTPGNIRRPLTVLSVDEWERLSQVTGNSGAVNSYMVRKLDGLLEVYLWPSPDAVDAANPCVLLMQVQAPGPIALTDDVSFPQEWRIALRWGLAEDICTGQPQNIVDRCMNNARTYREMLENWDVEDAPTYFNVDMRMRQGYGRFR